MKIHQMQRSTSEFKIYTRIECGINGEKDPDEHLQSRLFYFPSSIPNMFIKGHVFSSDNFVAIMGTWAPSSTKILVIYVYAPQEVTEKRVL